MNRSFFLGATLMSLMLLAIENEGWSRQKEIEAFIFANGIKNITNQDMEDIKESVAISEQVLRGTGRPDDIRMTSIEYGISRYLTEKRNDPRVR